MEASVVSFFLQEYEVKILQQIYLWCVDNNYIKENVCVLCADGIMLRNELIEGCEVPVNEKGDQTFPAMEVMIKEKTGFDVKITNKPLDGGWTDEFLDEHKITAKSLDRKKFKRFDTDYCNSLVGYLYPQENLF